MYFEFSKRKSQASYKDNENRLNLKKKLLEPASLVRKLNIFHTSSKGGKLKNENDELSTASLKLSDRRSEECNLNDNKSDNDQGITRKSSNSRFENEQNRDEQPLLNSSTINSNKDNIPTISSVSSFDNNKNIDIIDNLVENKDNDMFTSTKSQSRSKIKPPPKIKTKKREKSSSTGFRGLIPKKFIRNKNEINEEEKNNDKTEETNETTIYLPIAKFGSNDDIPEEKQMFKDEKLPYSSSNENSDYNNNKNISDNSYDNTAHFSSAKLKYYIKVTLKFAFSQIGLAGLVIGYVILGSLIFMKIESSYEKETQEKIESNREGFYRDVRLAAEQIVNENLRLNFHFKYNQYRNEEMNGNLFMGNEVSNNIIQNSPIMAKIVYQNIDSSNNNNNTAIVDNNSTLLTTNNTTTKKSKSSKERVIFKEQENDKKNSWHVKIDEEAFRREISYLLKVFLNENDKIEDKDKTTFLREEVWTYSSALLYSATVITTIGYGNITPKSNIGKIFTMIYAMIGIPLMFMCLTNTGDLLAELFINVYSKTIRFFYRRLCKHKLKMFYSSSKYAENKAEMLTDFEMEYDNPNDRHVPIVATIGVLSGYIFTGAVIFSYWENWSYLDGAYFCFITFTTIGFGDFVPGKNTLSTDKGGKAALCTLYLLAGMIIMAMCFKLMQDEVFSKARWIGRKLGILDKE